MDNPIIYQVIGGLLVLLFFYLTYMFTKTWRWVHVLFVFGVFTATIFFCVLAAMTVRTHVGWKQLVVELRDQHKQLLDEHDKLRYGDRLEVVQTGDSVMLWNARLGRVLLDRGRVWRHCTPGQPDSNGTVTVNTQSPGAATATPNRIDPQTVLYVFVELEATPEIKEEFGLGGASAKLPVHYVGEFTAATVTDTSVTLQPTGPIINPQAMRQPGVTWALYETMPVDGHTYYADNPLSEPDWSQDAETHSVFGDINQETIQTVFGPYRPPAGNEQATARFQQMLVPYLRDGFRGVRQADPPNNVWLKVRFVKAHEEDVDSEAMLDAVTSSETFFDRGRANVPLVQRGEPARFKVNDYAIFPMEYADQLIANEIAELEDVIYVRSLRDYNFLFTEVRLQMASVVHSINRVQRDNQSTESANTLTEEQIAFREKERDALNQDLSKFQYEVEQISTYLQTVKDAEAQRMSQLSQLYRVNLQLAEELARLEAAATEKIDEETREAVQSVAGGD